MAALLVAIPGFQNPLALAMGEYVKAHGEFFRYDLRKHNRPYSGIKGDLT